MKYILRIDMSTRSAERQSVPDSYKLLGGRGLTSAMISDEVDPTCDPLGERNKVVLAPGLLGGTTAPCSGRLSVGAKSPLTGGIKESNAGGTFAQKIARLGIKAISIENRPEADGTYILAIDEDGCKFIEDKSYKFLGNYRTVEKLRESYGDDISVLSIGPAGEYGYSIASVACTDLEGAPTRHAARGGIGSVLGSKGVKAIVVKTNNLRPLVPVQPDVFREVSTGWAKNLVDTRKILTTLGTASLVNTINMLGMLPTDNYQKGEFEGADNINGEKLAELIKQRGGKIGHPCHRGCVIRCSNIYNNEEGEYVTSGLEYETIALNGSNLGISDLDFIAGVSRFCDDFGIDTMDTGITLGVAAEAGIAAFGNPDSFMSLLDEMNNRTVLGKVLGQGAEVAGRVFGVRRVPVIKGQGLSAYDPRGLKGTGVTYMTSPMGADHTAGNVLPGRGGFRTETRGGAPHDSDDRLQVQVSRDIQIMAAVCDIAGLCIFVGTTEGNMDVIAQLISARYGVCIKAEDLLATALNTIKTEIRFNEKAGISETHNLLPEFMTKEPLAPRSYVFNIPVEDINAIWD